MGRIARDPDAGMDLHRHRLRPTAAARQWRHRYAERAPPRIPGCIWPGSASATRRLIEQRDRAGAPSDRAAIGRCSKSVILPHFLCRAGIHFVCRPTRLAGLGGPSLPWDGRRGARDGGGQQITRACCGAGNPFHRIREAIVRHVLPSTSDLTGRPIRSATRSFLANGDAAL